MEFVAVGFAGTCSEAGDSVDDVSGAFAMEAAVFSGEEYEFVLVCVVATGAGVFVPDEEISDGEVLLHN